jgi:lipoate-protein ligase B
VNVDNDLRPFEWVVACGLPGVQMTSIARELGNSGHLRCFRKRMAFRFAEAFGRRQRLVSAARLEAAIGAAPIPA